MSQFADPTRQEVWETLQALNRAWTRGRPDELRKYFHPDMVAITPTDRDRLQGAEACIAGWTAFVAATTIHRWREIAPRIQLYGDTAVVTYEFDMAFDMGGQRIDLGGRDMFVFVRENGRWLAVADQFSPFPQAGPAAP